MNKSSKFIYILIIFFLSVGFLPLENMALCIDKDGHTEIEIVDVNTKKCSDFILALAEKVKNPVNSSKISLADDHCSSCNDLLLGTDSFTFSSNQIDLSYLQPIILDYKINYLSAKNISKKFGIFIDTSDFTNPTLLSVKSVKILC